MTKYSFNFAKSILIFCILLQTNYSFATHNYHYNPETNKYYTNFGQRNPKKWEKFPVTVYLSNLPANYNIATKNAVLYWKKYFPFELSDNPNSDVTIKLVRYFSQPASSKTIGLAIHSYNNGIHKCTIELLLNKNYSQSGFNEVILHELGHAAGLDESTNPNEIMYSTVREREGRITNWTFGMIGYIPFILPTGFQTKQEGKSIITQGDVNKLAEIYKEPQQNQELNYTANNQSQNEIPVSHITANHYIQGTPSNFVNDKISEGNNFYYAKNYTQAIECYKKVLAINPNHPIVNGNVGLCYLKMNKNDEAIEYFDKSLKVNPHNADNYSNIALAYRNKRDYAKAELNCKKAIEANPQSAMAYCNLGSLYIDTGKYDLGISNSQKAITLDPKCETAIINLGVAYGYKGEYNKAKEELKKALLLNPNSTAAKTNLNNINSYTKRQ